MRGAASPRYLPSTRAEERLIKETTRNFNKIPAVYINDIFQTEDFFGFFGLSLVLCKDQSHKTFTLPNYIIEKRTIGRRVVTKKSADCYRVKSVYLLKKTCCT